MSSYSVCVNHVFLIFCYLGASFLLRAGQGPRDRRGLACKHTFHRQVTNLEATPPHTSPILTPWATLQLPQSLQGQKTRDRPSAAQAANVFKLALSNPAYSTSPIPPCRNTLRLLSTSASCSSSLLMDPMIPHVALPGNRAPSPLGNCR